VVSCESNDNGLVLVAVMTVGCVVDYNIGDNDHCDERRVENMRKKNMIF